MADQPELITPSHGRGKLFAGGKPGNRGGSGRPPSAIKSLCREGFNEAVETIKAIARGQKPNPDAPQPTYADMMRAIDILGRYGFKEQPPLVPDQMIEAVAKVLAEHVPPDRIAEFSKEITDSLDNSITR